MRAKRFARCWAWRIVGVQDGGDIKRRQCRRAHRVANVREVVSRSGAGSEGRSQLSMRHKWKRRGKVPVGTADHH